MKLTYRGVAYTINLPFVPFVPSVDDIAHVPSSSPTIGKYRGATLYIHQPKQPPQLQPSVKLQYRGTPYRPALHRSDYPASEMA